MALHFFDHGLRHFALIQTRRALGGNQAQYRGIFRVFQQMPYRYGFTIGLVEIGFGIGIIGGQKFFRFQEFV